MPYEYKVEYLTTVDGQNQTIEAWLNTRGLKGWRLVDIDEGWNRAIFERKIEANQKLRNIQLGKETQDDDGKKSETERD